MKRLILASAAVFALGLAGTGAAHARQFIQYYGDDAFALVLPGQVAQAQRELARAGFYHGAIDGDLGTATSVALADWQAAHGLAATGGFNPPTMASLGLRTGYPYYYTTTTRFASRAPHYVVGYGSSYRPRLYGDEWIGY
ncbi:MAG: peptidoglycan-binding domain-containing protein [Thiohalocapsa sp.]